jgi:hypothetical protein
MLARPPNDWHIGDMRGLGSKRRLARSGAPNQPPLAENAQAMLSSRVGKHEVDRVSERHPVNDDLIIDRRAQSGE